MLKYLLSGVAVVVCALLGGGVAVATPVPVPDVSQSVNTVDHYTLSASLTEVTINSVPNMAATAFSREGYLSGTATASIDGSSAPMIDGQRLPVIGGKLELSLMVGCQIDLSQGGYLGGNTDIGFGNFLNALTAVPPLIVNDSEGLGTSFSETLRPGTIKYQKLNEKQIPADFAVKEISESGTFSLGITVHDAHLKVDGCGGPVSVRLIATAQMGTPHHDDEVNVYGDTLTI